MNTNPRVNRISCVPQADGSIDITVPAAIAEEFKQMVRRATGCWQEQSDEMRDFADRVLGRAAAMGANMKPEIFGYPVTGRELNAADLAAVEQANKEYREEIRKGVETSIFADLPSTALAKRSCCGTLLREPHHSQCEYLRRHLDSQCVNLSQEVIAKREGVVKSLDFHDSTPKS